MSGKSAASSKYCGWWQCDNINDVAQGGRKGWDEDGGERRGVSSVAGGENKGVAREDVLIIASSPASVMRSSGCGSLEEQICHLRGERGGERGNGREGSRGEKDGERVF
ncbi:hypothetical protein CesoFtcFv8_005482 [Champsocephalus esox]|uniref:Uncharacterized protein n=1 Tax=Champsocephalus esox TaxID=159716 RepID=A0AAN8CPI1_9TELE|nr:hypothetical protein CesoFtcFv8_005482 [Champsocephalus esox]